MSVRNYHWSGLLLIVACCLLFTSSSFAQTLNSPSYRFDESTLGQGGLPESSSASYTGKSSLGDLAVGYTGSANDGFQGGSQTTPDPRLAVAVTDNADEFPQFSASTPSMTTAAFEVLNYTSYNYAVFITGPPPTNSSNGHEIEPLEEDVTTTDAESIPGSEQFGMNLIENTDVVAPENIGANPDNGQGQGLTGFAFGAASDNYNQNGRFRYVEGEMIASSTKSGGYTGYTISYLINVARLTPGGKYTSAQSLVVVGTY